MDIPTIFFITAAITLIQLVYTDLKAREVDARLSYYMYGVLGFVFLYLNQVWTFVIFLVITTIALAFLKEKVSKWIGEGDISILAWVLPGLAILSLPLFLLYVIFYGLSMALMFGFFKKKILPGTVPLFLALMVVWFIFLLQIV